MKIWAKLYQEHKRIDQVVREFSSARPVSIDGWAEVMTELCKPLDLACPVLLNKHVSELARFSRTVFYPGDFMESVSFTRFEIEIFPEKKKETHVSYSFDAH